MVVAVAGASKSASSRWRPHAMQWICACPPPAAWGRAGASALRSRFVNWGFRFMRGPSCPVALAISRKKDRGAELSAATRVELCCELSRDVGDVGEGRPLVSSASRSTPQPHARIFFRGRSRCCAQLSRGDRLGTRGNGRAGDRPHVRHRCSEQLVTNGDSAA